MFTRADICRFVQLECCVGTSFHLCTYFIWISVCSSTKCSFHGVNLQSDIDPPSYMQFAINKPTSLGENPYTCMSPFIFSSSESRKLGYFKNSFICLCKLNQSKTQVRISSWVNYLCHTQHLFPYILSLKMPFQSVGPLTLRSRYFTGHSMLIVGRYNKFIVRRILNLICCLLN
jgi:hypothetical protein